MDCCVQSVQPPSTPSPVQESEGVVGMNIEASPLFPAKKAPRLFFMFDTEWIGVPDRQARSQSSQSSSSRS